MCYNISKMNSSHIEGIVNIENECFSSPWTYEGIKEELNNENSYFLVAENSDIMGYIGVQEICGEAYITNVGVLPEYRRRGIGKKLLMAAIEGAKSRNCEFITLEVRESNIAAISLYESLGFALVGKRNNFYQNPNENALLYTLRF